MIRKCLVLTLGHAYGLPGILVIDLHLTFAGSKGHWIDRPPTPKQRGYSHLVRDPCSLRIYSPVFSNNKT